MLPLILLLVVTQLPCVQGDSTAVCRCKQGSASGCAALDPRKAAEIAQAIHELKIDEEARQKQAASSTSAKVQESSDAPEPPDCKGQQHHVISKPIAKELELHPTLMGVYEPRDSRFVTKAVDEAAHCGYQDWHRKIDAEVINYWLRTHKSATAKEFETFLRSVYNRPDMRARFPRGF
ncbi:Wall-associated protein precursor [Cystobacter fuscus]|uniref:Wall-associated protein n=1 Tax=Cystobacter fuscus TaxID=43 RepID=A0A250JFB6_9BACT|nr:Wall-associated protein precursor [Cystobacter fuscus]ATB42293.1 Wall-associated protein precursor [Cystobacter fuscus]